MMLLNNDRLSHWLVGAVIGWTACLFLVYIPIFHWGLGFRIAKIAVSACIGCAGQLTATPWLFSARATAEKPSGKVGQRAIAVIVWFSSSALLLFYYVQRDWPNDSHGQALRACVFGTTIVLGIVGLIIVGVISRNRGRA